MIDVESKGYWQDFAACNPAAPNARVRHLGDVDALFFRDGRNIAQARAVCQDCPVRAFCRRDIDSTETAPGALVNPGVFAGETAKERGTRRARTAVP